MLANQFQNRRKFENSGLAIINTRYSDRTGIASKSAQIWGGNLLTLLSSISDVIIIGGVFIDLLVLILSLIFIFGRCVRFHSNVSLRTFLRYFQSAKEVFC